MRMAKQVKSLASLIRKLGFQPGREASSSEFVIDCTPTVHRHALPQSLQGRATQSSVGWASSPAVTRRHPGV